MISISIEKGKLVHYHLIKQVFDLKGDEGKYLLNGKLRVITARLSATSELIGLCSFEMISQTTVRCNYTWVKAMYRGQKLNHLMKNAVSKYAREEGFTKMTANVREHNTSSITSLLKNGWYIEEVGKTKYRNREERVVISKNIQ